MLPSVFVAVVFAAVPPVDPEAAFTLADGRLGVRVTRGAEPLSGARVRCLVGTQVWATSDTDADGRVYMPRPPKDWCQVVVDVGAGPTSPIPLSLLPPDGVVPKSWTVGGDAAECCVVPTHLPRAEPKSAPKASPNAVPEVLLGLALGTVVSGLAYAVWRWRAVNHKHPRRRSP
jgi:hypothetical protein